MNDAELAKLRQEIDAIDEALHDLIMRRTAVGDRVREAKQGNDGPIFRPAREARILRRLAERHQGGFPKSALMRIWREIISATLRLQGPFSVAAYAPENTPACRDLAREHFGATTPVTAHQSTRSVVHAISEGAATVGVVPLPEENEPNPWWPVLLSDRDNSPSIVARLPFAPAGEIRGEWPEGLVLGRLRQEASGQDRSFLIVRASSEVSRARLRMVLDGADMEPLYMITRADDDDGAMTQFLVEINGFVDSDDARLGKLMEEDNPPIATAVAVGGYAIPFTEAELATAAPKERESGR